MLLLLVAGEAVVGAIFLLFFPSFFVVFAVILMKSLPCEICPSLMELNVLALTKSIGNLTP